MERILLVLKALVITASVMGLFFVCGASLMMIIVAIVENIKGVDNLEPLENNNEVYH